MTKIRKIAIPVTEICSPEEYTKIKPGDNVVSLHDGKMWRAVNSTKEYITIIPFFGGIAYKIPVNSGKVVFGKIEIPGLLKEQIAL